MLKQLTINNFTLIADATVPFHGGFTAITGETGAGKSVYWVNNRQINYTNVCVLHCKFCAFSRIKKDSPTAYDWNKYY